MHILPLKLMDAHRNKYIRNASKPSVKEKRALGLIYNFYLIMELTWKIASFC